MKLWPSFFTDFNRNRAVDLQIKAAEMIHCLVLLPAAKLQAHVLTLFVTAVFLRHSEINQVPAAIATSKT